MLYFTIFIAKEFYSLVLYDLPWEIRDLASRDVLAVRLSPHTNSTKATDRVPYHQGFLSTSWATASLVHVCQIKVLIPPVIAVIIYAGLTLTLVITFT
jgi:hypothetical protein